MQCSSSNLFRRFCHPTVLHLIGRQLLRRALPDRSGGI